MTDILVHVEDPGAANMVIGLPKVVGDLGYECKIYASCHAKDHLTKAGQSYKEVTTSSSNTRSREAQVNSGRNFRRQRVIQYIINPFCEGKKYSICRSGRHGM